MRALATLGILVLINGGWTLLATVHYRWKKGKSWAQTSFAALLVFLLSFFINTAVADALAVNLTPERRAFTWAIAALMLLQVALPYGLCVAKVLQIRRRARTKPSNATSKPAPSAASEAVQG